MTHSQTTEAPRYRYGPPRPIYGPNHPPAEDDGWEWWLIIDPEPLPYREDGRARPFPPKRGEKQYETGREPDGPIPPDPRYNLPP